MLLMSGEQVTNSDLNHNSEITKEKIADEDFIPFLTKLLEEEKSEIDDFEFNQDFEIEEGTRSPGWIRYQKRIKWNILKYSEINLKNIT